MKRISILLLISCACVSVASSQSRSCPHSVNWTEFLTIDMARWNPCEKVLNINNVRSLQLKWSYATGGPVYSSPAVANGVVYVGSGDDLYALNASTGALLWSYTTGGGVFSSPAVANGVVYVGSNDPNFFAVNFFALNASTGAELWSYPIENYGVSSSPAVVKGVVYVGSEFSYIYAFGLNKGRE